jgi:cytochrome c-550 PedF
MCPRPITTLAVTCLLLIPSLSTLAGTSADPGVPPAVDTRELAPLGPAWLTANPYRRQPTAIGIGALAFRQHCARCHGEAAHSTGIAPELRSLDRDCAGIDRDEKRRLCIDEIDAYYLSTVRHGRIRNGIVWMPPYEGVLDQEVLWAIRAYLETRRDPPVRP